MSWLRKSQRREVTVSHQVNRWWIGNYAPVRMCTLTDNIQAKPTTWMNFSRPEPFVAEHRWEARWTSYFRSAKLVKVKQTKTCHRQDQEISLHYLCSLRGIKLPVFLRRGISLRIAMLVTDLGGRIREVVWIWKSFDNWDYRFMQTSPCYV